MPAQSAPSEFEAYLSSLDENDTFSVAESAYSELNTCKFNDALCTAQKLGKIKFSSVWYIILQCPSIVQPIRRVISFLPSTQVLVERIFLI